jgi:ketosteroid isomerase-like protein
MNHESPNDGDHRMTDQASAALARGWIEAWIRMDIDWLRRRLTPDFVHVSPFGRLEGREAYLDVVEPLARKSVQELRVKGVIGRSDQAAVHFENRTPEGVVDSCDWLFVEDGRIKKVRSFYDTSRIRKVLSESEQNMLDSS